MSNWAASGAMWSKSSGLIVIPGNNAERHNVEPWRTYPPNPMYTAYYYHPLGTAIHLHRIPLSPESLSDTLDPFYTGPRTRGNGLSDPCACIPLTTYM